MSLKIQNKAKLTTEEIKTKMGGMGEYEAIQWAVEYINNHSPNNNLKKPLLGKDATSGQALDYATQLKIYEDALVIYNAQKAEYNTYKSEVYTIIENYISDVAGLDSIPDVYRSKIYRMAYQRGHSSGMYSVYQELVELVDIFN